ncbi:hypothetical protein BDQ17DRAFT_1362846 [Cyathus striatus]|nr:hypothetical protein BDQ17DRAFT_1362846 [Cyathus striatus]
MIRSAQTMLVQAKDSESKGDLRAALASYIKTASLVKMTMDSTEFSQERKGKGGVLRKEVSDFLDGEGHDLPALSSAVEEKLKAMDHSQPPNASDSTEAPSKPARSIAERVRALQVNGLNDASMGPPKRISRDLSNLPSPPPSATRFSSSSSSTQPQLSSITTVFPTSPPAAPTPSVFVPTSALGPPSPQSSPSSSPQMNNFDLSGFAQSFPPIDELDETFHLPTVPTGVSVASNKSNGNKDFRNGDSSSASPIASFRNFTVPIERPSSTPITPVNNAFASRPASPIKASPFKSSGLGASSSVSRPPIPVRNAATPKELASYIDSWNVLLIDVRNRGEFDQEHIDSKSVVCIEPHVLQRSNLTASALEDSMAVGPRNEGTLLVIATNLTLWQSTILLQPALAVLALPSPFTPCDIRASIHKMLKRMPMILIGGLEAWKRDIGDKGIWRNESTQNETQRPSPTHALGPVSNGHFTNGHYSPTIIDSTQTWMPKINGDAGHRTAYSVDHASGHARSPADVTYTGSHAAPERPVGRRPALSRPASGSLSYSRGIENVPPPLPLSAAPSTNGFSSSSSSIQYPQFPRRISPTASGSASASIVSSGFSPPTPYTSAPISYDITSPPQASINPSGLSRRRSDFVDQSQEALLSFNNTARAPIDYPDCRQDNRRVAPSSLPVSSSAPKPPRVNYEYPPTYWLDMEIGTATFPFARFFTGRWKNAVNFQNPLGSKGALTASFAELLREMWGGDMPYLVPGDFRRTVCKLNAQYNGADQHDSQEFLSFLIDGIHEDLNRILVRPKITSTPEQEAELETLPQQIASEREWRTWRSSNDSLIVDFFQGQFRNRLKCLTCHTTSTTYNVFSILQLPIPHTNSSKVHIQSCLDTLLNEEILERMMRGIRFKYKGKFVDKIDTFVDFPMKSLDLTNYMPAPLPPGADKSELNGGLPLSPDDPRTQLPPYKYDLYGVTNHYGSLTGGHYTASIASRGGWMYCDDSSVRPVDPKSVVNQKAYVLFYKRVRQ